MRSFLNAYETKAYIVLAGLRTAVNILFKNADGKEKTYLKYIETYTKKYQRCVRDRLSDEDNKKIEHFKETNKIKVMPNTDPTIPKVVLDKDQISDVAEIVLDKCCKDCPGDYTECKTRDVLIGCFVTECCFDKDKCCYYMGD